MMWTEFVEDLILNIDVDLIFGKWIVETVVFILRLSDRKGFTVEH